MQDSEDRPQRRLALAARELDRLDIDIAALSEVCFAEQGFLTEDGADYTLFWSEKNKDETVSLVSASGSKHPLPENCRTCQMVILTALCP